MSRNGQPTPLSQVGSLRPALTATTTTSRRRARFRKIRAGSPSSLATMSLASVRPTIVPPARIQTQLPNTLLQKVPRPLLPCYRSSPRLKIPLLLPPQSKNVQGGSALVRVRFRSQPLKKTAVLTETALPGAVLHDGVSAPFLGSSEHGTLHSRGRGRDVAGYAENSVPFLQAGPPKPKTEEAYLDGNYRGDSMSFLDTFFGEGTLPDFELSNVGKNVAPEVFVDGGLSDSSITK